MTTTLWINPATFTMNTAEQFPGRDLPYILPTYEALLQPLPQKTFHGRILPIKIHVSVINVSQKGKHCTTLICIQNMSHDNAFSFYKQKTHLMTLSRSQ